MGIIRTILALAVVFAHTPHPYVFVGGRNAVQMFYMISGFLISYVLLNTPTYRNPVVFWFNRALRLYPAYYVVAALTLVGYALFNPLYWQACGSLPAAAQAFMAAVNVTLIGQDWSLFMAVKDGGLTFSSPVAGTTSLGISHCLLVLPSWTLGLELSFYLIAPFIVRRPIVLLILFALSLTGRLFAIASGFGLDEPWSYRFFPFELALFIAGVFSHQLFLQPSIALVAKSKAKNVPTYVMALCVAAIAFYYAVPLPEAVKTPMLLALLFVSLPYLFIFQSRSKWDKLIGDLSYPIYIGHLLVLLTLAYLVRKYGFVEPMSWTRSLLGVAGAVIFAAFLKIFVTDPIETRRQRVKRGIAIPSDLAPTTPTAP